MKKIISILLVMIMIMGLAACQPQTNIDKPIEPILPEVPGEPETPDIPSQPETPSASTYKEDFETFDHEENSSEYQDYNFVGNHQDVIWQLYHARIDLKLENRAVTFKGRHRPDGFYGGMATTFKQGLSFISFDAMLPYTEKGHPVKIDLYVNDIVIKRFEVPIDKTNVPYHFELEQLNFKGQTAFEIAIESGKRVTIDNLIWKDNPTPKQSVLIVNETFDNHKFKYDIEETERVFGGLSFIVKELWTDDLHGQNERDLMGERHGTNVLRMRGKGDETWGTPDAYLYTKDVLASVSEIKFDAKFFNKYNEQAELRVYVKTETGTWQELELVTLTQVFDTYTVAVNRINVYIKIEVKYASINLDNLNIFN